MWGASWTSFGGMEALSVIWESITHALIFASGFILGGISFQLEMRRFLEREREKYVP